MSGTLLPSAAVQPLRREAAQALALAVSTLVTGVVWWCVSARF